MIYDPTRPNAWTKQVRENGTLDFGLHCILIYEMKNGEGKGGKHMEKGKKEKELHILHILHTRSYAALWAADLDWIVGPGYSMGRVHRHGICPKFYTGFSG